MDEKGFLIGILKKTHRIFTKSWKKQGKLQGAAQDGNRSWITLIAGICADGTSLPPALIYQASSGDIQDSWVDDYQPDDKAYFTSSTTGWTNNELGMEWLIRVFDHATKKKAGNGWEPRLLFLDGHGSHINMPFLEWCHTHNIHICAYPPHTTHRLQPLDKSIFSPLATYYSQELDHWIQATQGLCKMNKRQFYKLFKPAFEKAFSEQNIQSGWMQTGIYPLNPAQVLDQLSIKLAPPTSRPTTASSGSQSVISLSDWRKINQVVKDAVGDVLGYEGWRVLNVCSQLQAENALLKAQIEGLKEAVRIEKKQRKPKKALFAELRADNGNGAIFFLPAKILAARELQMKKAKEAEAVQVQKREEQLQRQLHKEEQAEIKRQAAAARQERREKVAAEKAEKQIRKEEALQQRLANLQLSNEQRGAGKTQQKKPQRAQDQILCSSAATELSKSRVDLQQEVRTSRSGRQLRKPQHLDNYEL